MCGPMQGPVHTLRGEGVRFIMILQSGPVNIAAPICNEKRQEDSHQSLVLNGASYTPSWCLMVLCKVRLQQEVL